jgi:hypothetical protein
MSPTGGTNQGLFTIRMLALFVVAFLLNSCGGSSDDSGGTCQRTCSNPTSLIVWGNSSRSECIDRKVSGGGAGICEYTFDGESLNDYFIYYQDADSDLFGNSAASTITNTVPAGYVRSAGDCNDSDATTNPSAPELENDGQDNDCDGEIDETVFYFDGDGDSFGDPTRPLTGGVNPADYVANDDDCNDGNASINPNAIEVGDFVDNNCDGQIDEGFFTFYRDIDGDGYGDANDRVANATQPAGYVTDNTDCDDLVAAANPGETEVGDGIDNDCDGEIDEGFMLYYRDNDGDAYGDVSDSQLALSAPSGYVDNYGDCDDTLSINNPDAVEVADGVDNNCNGYIDETSGSVLLNDTAITIGGNYPSGNNTDCSGESIAQQDCALGRDAEAEAATLIKTGAGTAGFDFTKLDSSGTPLADQSQDYATAPWACVRDNHTGLVWEVKTDDGGIHDRDTPYRWGGSTAQLIGEYGPQFDDWDTLVDGSNAETLCGFNDWRVPSRTELMSIIDYGGNSPVLDGDYFPNLSSNPLSFWTSEAELEQTAWSISMREAFMAAYDRSLYRFIRLVRNPP